MDVANVARGSLYCVDHSTVRVHYRLPTHLAVMCYQRISMKLYKSTKKLELALTQGNVFHFKKCVLY